MTDTLRQTQLPKDWEIKKQFEENQIEFAFPTQSIYLENAEKTK